MRALVVALLLACTALAARAEPDGAAQLHVVVVGNDAEFVSALELVMDANDTGVKAIGDRPTPSLAELGPESRQLADSHQAIATVWLSPTAAGATLVTYERSADRFMVREVPYKLPLDTTQAFETARMVRVMLRAVADRNDEDAVTRHVRTRPAPTTEPQFAAAVGGGAWFASPESAATAMATVAIAWRPFGVGAAASATIAPSADIDHASFEGDVRVWRVAAEARKSLRLGSRTRITPGIGLSLHHVALGGQFGVSDMVSTRRFNPAVTVGSVVGISLPHQVELGIAVAADCLLRRQRYAAGSEEILVVPRIQAMMGVLVGLRL